MSRRKAMMMSLSSGGSLPVIDGLVADFNFAKASSLSLSGGKIVSIIDAIGGIVNSQATAGQRPAYSATGGPNDSGYATFTGVETLNGALLTSSTTFSMFILRANDNGSLMGIWGNGTSANGYGIVDFYGSLRYQAALYPGVNYLQANFSILYDNKWSVVGFSSGANDKFYTPLGIEVTTNPPDTLTPITPTTGNTIGNVLSAVSKFSGKISRMLLFNRQLSASESKSVVKAMSAGTTLPFNFCTDGDSRFFYDGGYLFMTYIINDAIPSPYLSWNNVAVNGYTTDNILADMPVKVQGSYDSRTTNIFVVMAGYNDTNAGKTPTYIYNNLVTICNNAKSYGYQKVIICTDAGTTNVPNNAAQAIYNPMIRSNWPTFADAMCDMNAVPEMSPANMANPTYSADGVHWTQTLAQIAATTLLATINSIL